MGLGFIMDKEQILSVIHGFAECVLIVIRNLPFILAALAFLFLTIYFTKIVKIGIPIKAEFEGSYIFKKSISAIYFDDGTILDMPTLFEELRLNKTATIYYDKNKDIYFIE